MQRFWTSIVGPLLTYIDAKVIIEIGMGNGRNTTNLLNFVRSHGGTVHAIDPAPDCDTDALQREYGSHLAYYKDLSLNALPDIQYSDVVLIDGDHNWFTVLNELKLIERSAQEEKNFPLVLLHDIGWPYGRRDLYVDPELIPPVYRQPHKKGGLMPLSHNIEPDQGLNPDCFHSIYENTMQNGVLTAAEDFVKEASFSLSLTKIPGFHGFGILATDVHHTNKALDTFLRSLNVSDTVLELVDDLDRDRVHTLIDREDARQYDLQMDEQVAALSKQHEDMEQRILLASLEQKKAEQSMEAAKQSLNTMEQTVSEANVAYQELQRHVQSIEQSKSWLYTAWIRHLQAKLRKLSRKSVAYVILGNLKDLWTDFGQPFPGLVRHIRHGVLGRRIPVRSEQSGDTAPPSKTTVDAKTIPSSPSDEATLEVAVIIPCHNYAHYLGDAIESVLNQSVPAKEILVVDDASDDETAEVVASYADRGVRYLRGEWLSVGAARNAGIENTVSPYLIFLDADDLLHFQYIQSGFAPATENTDVGIIYSNQQHFGDRQMFFNSPEEFEWQVFDAWNHLNSAAIVRRDALLQAGMFSHGVDQDGDWITWRRILRLGWKTKKNDSVHFYRVHKKNMTASLNAKRSYPERAGFFEEPTSLCLSLSGRAWAWPLTVQFLESQTFPHHLIELVILDTSQDIEFGKTVRQWLSNCDYRNHTYMRESVAPKGIADLDRQQHQNQVARACATIYNKFARICTTTLVLFLEDDVIPPIDAFSRLVAQFDTFVVSVSGYVSHRGSGKPIAWKWLGDREPPEFTGPEAETSAVGGNGFGCLALRGEYLRHTVFHTGEPYGNFDHNFYYQVVFCEEREALVDWGVQCDHLSSPK